MQARASARQGGMLSRRAASGEHVRSRQVTVPLPPVATPRWARARRRRAESLAPRMPGHGKFSKSLRSLSRPAACLLTFRSFRLRICTSTSSRVSTTRRA